MLPSTQLKLALDLHARSYRLLRWLTDAINSGEIPLPQVVSPRHAEDVTTAMLDWIVHLQSFFPADLLPSREHLREFAAFFGTYLTSSFDLTNNTGLVSRNVYGGNCHCSLCTRLVNGSHLKTKKLTSADKRRAKLLVVDRLIELADEHQLNATVEQVEALSARSELRTSAAYSTYGYWLVQRTKGITDGASILALWRQIAWTDSGSPKRDFRLRYEDFHDAEQVLLTKLRAFFADYPM